MTSSLVGSEMCIRDSAAMVAGPVETLPLPAGAFLPGVAAPSGLHPVPVSYTHLTLPTICSV
eukprot:10267396-Prorocentrum_lima.AAC.1